jgi:hypothetical protein
MLDRLFNRRAPDPPAPTTEQWKKRTVYGNETDIADKLPPAARDKLETLRGEAEALRVVAKIPRDRGQEVSEKIRVVKRRINELKSVQGYAENHPLIAAEREALAKFEAENAKLAAEYVDKSRVSIAGAHVAKRCENYLYDNTHAHFTLAPPTPAPTLAKNETIAGAVDKLRSRIAGFRAEERTAANAPKTAADAKQIVRAQIAKIAEAGKIDPFDAIEAGRPLKFAEVVLQNGAGNWTRIPDAFSTFAWLFKDQIIARLEAEVDAKADDSAALDDETRAARIAEARREILSLEREEEAMVTLARSTGLAFQRRADADPRAILGLADSLPEPGVL